MSEFLSGALIVIGVSVALAGIAAYKNLEDDYEHEMAIGAVVLGWIFAMCCFLASFYIALG